MAGITRFVSKFNELDFSTLYEYIRKKVGTRAFYSESRLESGAVH